MLRGLRAAFTFLTVIPVGGFPFPDSAWRWSAAWFPLVGGVLGFTAAGAFVLLRPAGVSVAAVGAVAITVILTGAFHEDGLADSADALGGAYDRETLFTILKDSRVGSYGGLALVLTVAARAACLAALDAGAPLALVVSHVAARTSPVWMMATIPYVTSNDTSKSRPVVRTSWPQVFLATILTLGLIGGLVARSVLAWEVAVILGAVLIVGAVLCGRYFLKRAGGITGDFLGATEQVNEILVLVVLAYS
ncbi:MAG: adenosylcobinamide-GDP ribazoletransferase [Polyangiales bacterium]